MKLTNGNYRYPHEVKCACAEVIIIITDISASASANINMAEAHEKICKRFDAVIKQCRVHPLPDDAAQELLYPLAALADETVLSIPQYRFFWSERPLQLRYFGEIAAGTKFFSRLEARMRTKTPNIYALEMYFVGLALGLKGIHGAHDQRRCVQIFENLGMMLRKARHSPLNIKVPCESLPQNRLRRVLPINRRIVYPAIVLLIIAAAAAVRIITEINLLNFLDRGVIN